MFRLLCCAVLAAAFLGVVRCVDEAEDRSSEVRYGFKRHYGYAPAPIDPLLLPLGHGHHDYHHVTSHVKGPLGHHSLSHGYSDYVGPTAAALPIPPPHPTPAFLVPDHHGHQVKTHTQFTKSQPNSMAGLVLMIILKLRLSIKHNFLLGKTIKDYVLIFWSSAKTVHS